MDARPNRYIYAIKDTIRLFFSISLGIFLFILFFEPFPIDHLDFNNKLIFIAGFALIVYLILVLARVIFPFLSQNYDKSQKDAILPYYLRGFLILAVNTVAFAFYLGYVGSVSISFYIMFKIVIICLIPSISLWLSDVIKELKLENKLLAQEIEDKSQQVLKYEKDYHNISMDFISEKSSENLSLLISDIAFIRSANNYIEIVFREGDKYKKRLQRNTLRNIEHQLKPYTNFVRCHRTCIINVYYVEKLSRTKNSYWLIVKGFDEQIPVSRQYLVKVKEAI